MYVVKQWYWRNKIFCKHCAFIHKKDTVKSHSMVYLRYAMEGIYYFYSDWVKYIFFEVFII